MTSTAVTGYDRIEKWRPRRLDRLRTRAATARRRARERKAEIALQKWLEKREINLDA